MTQAPRSTPAHPPPSRRVSSHRRCDPTRRHPANRPDVQIRDAGPPRRVVAAPDPPDVVAGGFGAGGADGVGCARGQDRGATALPRGVARLKGFGDLSNHAGLVFTPYSLRRQTRLEKTVAEKFCRSLVYKILDGIQTKERSGSLAEFLMGNPGVRRPGQVCLIVHLHPISPSSSFTE